VISLIGLVVVLSAIAAQPCLASPLPPAGDCCGNSTRCHQPVAAKICAMRSTTFAQPEHTAPATTLAAVSAFTPELAAPTSSINAVVPPCPFADSSGLYLRISILLI